MLLTQSKQTMNVIITFLIQGPPPPPPPPGLSIDLGVILLLLVAVIYACFTLWNGNKVNKLSKEYTICVTDKEPQSQGVIEMFMEYLKKLKK